MGAAGMVIREEIFSQAGAGIYIAGCAKGFRYGAQRDIFGEKFAITIMEMRCIQGVQGLRIGSGLAG